MTKKNYIQPALQVLEINFGSRILSGSLTQSTKDATVVDDGTTELGARGFGSIFDDDDYWDD